MSRPIPSAATPLLRAATTLLLLALLTQEASPAPAPFDRGQRQRPFHRDDLVGTWDVTWGTHRCAVTLTAGGDYACDWFRQVYVGSWRFDHDGLLWITESIAPADPNAWRSYAIRLDPATMTGRVEIGCPGVEVRLRRVRGK